MSDREGGRMSIHEQARAEAEKRMPGRLVELVGDLEYNVQAARMRKAFVEGAVWAATRTRVVTTVAELAAIPHNYETIVRGNDGRVWQRSRNAWDCLSEDGTAGLYPSSAVDLPARVLYEPEEDR